MPRRRIATTDTAVALTSLQLWLSAPLAARLDALTAATRLAGAAPPVPASWPIRSATRSGTCTG